MRAVLLALCVAACASASGEGVTADWASNSFVDAAEISDGQWLVSCDNAASACTRRARALCPAGFEVVSNQAGQAVSGAVGQYGGGFNTRRQYNMVVRCR